MVFEATLFLGGKTATGFAVPESVMTSLGAGKRVPVRVTINGYIYRSTVAPYGGEFMIPVSAENRAGAGIAAGQVIEVSLEVDTEPREVQMPQDFADALNEFPVARQYFEDLSYTHRKEYVRHVEAAKTAETRSRRIQKTMETLRSGRN